MNVNGIGAVGYETRKTQRKMAGKEYTDPMSDMVQTTQMPRGIVIIRKGYDQNGHILFQRL